MKWLSLFQRSKQDPDMTARYKAWRRLARELNLKLIRLLPQTAVPECGKKLGVVKAGTLVLGNDDEIAVIYDYCLYHHRRGNKNVIERYLEQNPPPDPSEERTLLEAMLHARSSAFRINAIRPHQGAELVDLAYGETIELTDLALADSGIAGTVVVGRILTLPELQMSSGTLVPVPETAYVQSIAPLIDKFFTARRADDQYELSPAQNASFTALLLRIALHAGGEDNMFYTDIDHA